MNEVAGELGCDWHTVNDTVVSYGEALLDADDDRIGMVTALGLDEVLMVRLGPYHRQHFSTQMVNVRAGDSFSTSSLVGAVPSPWPGWPTRDRPSGHASSSALSTCRVPTGGCSRSWCPAPPWSLIPFTWCKLANTKLDECRRRVQNETLGTSGTEVRSALPVPAVAHPGEGAP